MKASPQEKLSCGRLERDSDIEENQSCGTPPMDDRYGDDSRTLGPDIDALQQGGSNPEKSQDEVIKQLLNVMYHHKDREAAIAAARAAVMSLYQDQVGAPHSCPRPQALDVKRGSVRLAKLVAHAGQA